MYRVVLLFAKLRKDCRAILKLGIRRRKRGIIGTLQNRDRVGTVVCCRHGTDRLLLVPFPACVIGDCRVLSMFLERKAVVRCAVTFISIESYCLPAMTRGTQACQE